jgi:predicted MFS family arabinose efflux permease
VAGALMGPVLGGVASLTGTGLAFGAVAVTGFALMAWAWATPSFPPQEEPQRAGVLVRAFREREVVSGFWLVSLAAMLLGVISVVAPLRLDDLGWGALGISAAFLVSAGVEAGLNPFLGRWSDRYGRLAPVRAGLFAAIAASAILPFVDLRWPYLLLVMVAGVAYGIFWVPGTALLSDGAETAGIDQGFGMALLNVAWAPANVVGAATAGVLTQLADDAAYAFAVGVCLATLAATQWIVLDRTPAAESEPA